jgi:hypothetical protein
MSTALYSYIKRSYLKTFPEKDFTIKLNILLLLLALKIDSKTQKPILPFNFDKVLKENNIKERLFELAKFFQKNIPNLTIFDKILNNLNVFSKTTLQSYLDNKQTFIKNLRSLDINFNHDNLGFAYQTCMGKDNMQSLCAYYTPLSIAQNIIQDYLKIDYSTPIFDPFCGTGCLNVILPFATGYDDDKYAVDIANINKFMFHGIVKNPYIQNDFNNLKHEKHQYDYIFTNIPFQKSAKQNEALIINLSKMVGKKAAVILPSNHFSKMKNLPITHDFKIVKHLDNTIFEPFTKVCTDVLLITKI